MESLAPLRTRSLYVYASIITLAAVEFALGGFLAMIRLPIVDVSLQMVATVVVAISLLAGLAITLRVLTVWQALLGIYGAYLLIQTAYSLMQVDFNRRDGQYIAPLLIFLATFILFSTPGIFREKLRILVLSSLALSVLAPIAITLGAVSDGRHIVLALAISQSFLLWAVKDEFSSRLAMVVLVCAITCNSITVYISTGRMSSFVLSLTVVLFLLLTTKWSRAIRVALIVFQASLFALLSLVSGAWHRWVGGDNAFEVASVPISSSGRVDAWTSSVNSAGISLFGDGLGSSAAASRIVGVLDKPLNEYVRLVVDLGVLGLIGWVALLALLAANLICNFKSASNRNDQVAGITLTLALLFFSLTEPLLSYAWILLPVGVFLSQVMRPWPFSLRKLDVVLFPRRGSEK